MNKYKRLLGDSIIYLIGNIGSKVIALLMVSFYSYMLSPIQFGKIDVTQTTISLMLPFVTVCIHEAVLRFCLKKENSYDTILSNGIIIIISTVLISIPLCFLMDSLNLIGGNVWFIILLVIFEGINVIFGQFCRGINKTKVFIVAGMSFTFMMAASNIFFLKVFKLGISGYFLAMIVGYSASILVLAIGGKIYKYIKISSVDKQLLVKMVKYSAPLIPNSIMWWLMNAADKYVILLCIGEEANGLYAVAGKLPAILATLSTIFMQAWQVSAISESDARDKDTFYSSVFGMLSSMLFILVSGILIVLKPLLNVVINTTYTDVWKYVPFLLISTVFSSFSTFLGANYTAMGKTLGALRTTLVGGVLNVLFNVIFIKILGLNGAAIATALSFLIVWLLRVQDTKAFVNITIQKKILFISLALIGIQIAALYTAEMLLSIVIGIFVLILLTFLNHKMIVKAIDAIKKER